MHPTNPAWVPSTAPAMTLSHPEAGFGEEQVSMGNRTRCGGGGQSEHCSGAMGLTEEDIKLNCEDAGTEAVDLVPWIATTVTFKNTATYPRL